MQTMRVRHGMLFPTPMPTSSDDGNNIVSYECVAGNITSFSFYMASNYVRILCGAQFYSGSTNTNVASRRTEVFFGE